MDVDKRLWTATLSQPFDSLTLGQLLCLALLAKGLKMRLI